MDAIVVASVVVLLVALFGLAYLSYRKHSRVAEAKSAAALAQLLAEGEQLAAQAPPPAQRPSDGSPSLAAPIEAPVTGRDPAQEAFERGYRQGFRDGLAVAGSDDAGEPTP